MNEMIRDAPGLPPTLGTHSHADEVAALAHRAAIEAFAIYRAAVPSIGGDGAGPEQLVPEGAEPPAAPLLAALADLGCAAHAAARMVEVVDVAGSAGSRDQRLEAAEMAACAASAAGLAVAPRSDLDQWVLRLEVAHFAARAAHLAAHVLPCRDGRAGSSRPSGEHRPPPIPPSRRRLLGSLSELLHPARGGALRLHDDEMVDRLIDAAAAARDAAVHLVAAYDSCPTSDPACRFARISIRAACNAGFAALEPVIDTPVAAVV